MCLGFILLKILTQHACLFPALVFYFKGYASKLDIGTFV
jgi:hypothetical protein